MSKKYFSTTQEFRYKNILSSWFFACLFLFSLLFSIVWFARSVDTATPPSIITYQGKLLENGASVTTTKAMAFVIYDADSGGTALYTAAGTLPATSTVSVTPTQGIFSVDLGGSGTNALDSTIFQDNDELYLEVVVDGTTLTPRKRLTASPYAVNSTYLNGAQATSTPQSTTYIPMSDIDGSFMFNTTTFNNAITVSSTATSTFLGGIDLATGNCFAVNNVCITGGGGSSKWTQDTDFIYLTDTNDAVVIGTSTWNGVDVLQVNGSAFFAGTTTFMGQIQTPDNSFTITDLGAPYFSVPTKVLYLGSEVPGFLGGDLPGMIVVSGNYVDSAAARLTLLNTDDVTAPVFNAGMGSSSTMVLSLGRETGGSVVICG